MPHAMRAFAYIDSLRLIDRLMPPQLGTHEARRGSRLVVRVTLITLSVCFLMQLVYLTEGATAIATMVWLSIALQLLGLVMHRGTGSFRVGGHIHILSLWTLFFGIAALSGGIDSPNIVANIFVVVLASLLLGRRHGLVWLPVTVATYVVQFQLAARGIVHQTLAAADIPSTRLTELVVTSITIGITAYVFASNEERMRAEVAREKERVEVVNADLRVILDSTGQGFLGLDTSGRVTGERSAVVDSWFLGVKPGVPFWSLLEPLDARVAERFEVEWTQVEAGVLPLQLCLGQLPKLMEVGETTLRLECRPALTRDGKVAKYVVVISDISAEVAREVAEVRQRDLLQGFDRILRDPLAFRVFLKSSRRDVLELQDGSLSGAELKRRLHTLKGNSAMMGLSAVARACHDLEDTLASEAALTPFTFRTLVREFEGVDARLGPFVATHAGDIALEVEEYDDFMRALAAHQPHRELLRVARTWQHGRASRHLTHLAEYAQKLAERLSKGSVLVRVEGGELRLPERFSEFWDVLVHVVRNAVDHGLESPDERQALGKGPGTLRLRISMEKNRPLVELTDDGRGLDWAAIRRIAEERQLPAASEADLLNALLSDGFSTVASVTEVSGRGVGMGSVRTVCAELGIEIRALSSPGAGTTFLFLFPEPTAELQERRVTA